LPSFSQRAIKYFTGLKSPRLLPSGIDVLNPYSGKEARRVVTKFYSKFFNDAVKRIFLLGINPGRFGGGITGIAFTDPVALEKNCAVKNEFPKKTELSSKFVYTFIDKYGGAKKFYSRFFIGALYPLVLLHNGKNYNYYGSPGLYAHLRPFIISSIKKHVSFGARKDIVICLGKKNAKCLREINNELEYFKKIVVLDHPRYIMQYRLKKVDEYAQKYMNVLRSSLKEIPR
jgi:hypothetical protein